MGDFITAISGLLLAAAIFVVIPISVIMTTRPRPKLKILGQFLWVAAPAGFATINWGLAVPFVVTATVGLVQIIWEPIKAFRTGSGGNAAARLTTRSLWGKRAAIAIVALSLILNLGGAGISGAASVASTVGSGFGSVGGAIYDVINGDDDNDADLEATSQEDVDEAEAAATDEDAEAEEAEATEAEATQSRAVTPDVVTDEEVQKMVEEAVAAELQSLRSGINANERAIARNAVNLTALERTMAAADQRVFDELVDAVNLVLFSSGLPVSPAVVSEICSDMTVAECGDLQASVEAITGETLVREADLEGTVEYDKAACTEVLNAVDGLTGNALDTALEEASANDEMLANCVAEGDVNLDEHPGALSDLVLYLSQEADFDLLFSETELDSQLELGRALRDDDDLRASTIELLTEHRVDAYLEAIDGTKQTHFYVDDERIEVGETAVTRASHRDIVLTEVWEFTIKEGETLLSGVTLEEDMTVTITTHRRLECGFQRIVPVDTPEGEAPEPDLVCRGEDLVRLEPGESRIDGDVDPFRVNGRAVCKPVGGVMDDIESEARTGEGVPDDTPETACQSDDPPADCSDDGFIEGDLEDAFDEQQQEVIDLCDATDDIESTIAEVEAAGYYILGLSCLPKADFFDEDSGNSGEDIEESLDNEGDADDAELDTDGDGTADATAEGEDNDGEVESL